VIFETSLKLMVCLDCQNALTYGQTWSRTNFCTSLHVVTYGAFFKFIILFLWHIGCLWYIRRKKFLLCYIGRCLNWISCLSHVYLEEKRSSRSHATPE